MSIPHFDDLRKPILMLSSNGEVWKKSEFTQPLIKHFNLTTEEASKEYESGNGLIFADRISWALSYFALTGILDRPKRGYYILSSLGKSFLDKTDEEVNVFVKQKMAERQAEKLNETDLDKDIQKNNINQNSNTPQEQLYASYETIRQETYDEILDTILTKTPIAFERLVVELLQNMGYGGAVEKAGRVTQYTKDGGIDGEIYEDVLGLGRIHIQAKRYQKSNTIGRPDIQSFAGALLGDNANKGVFITTSRFSADAITYAQNLSNARIALIDGQKLAEYIYKYGLGVQIEQTISIKKLDTDYWDVMPDDVNLTMTELSI
ncbi:restriction endonuclease [Psychrobacter sp. M13]|uniref:restriction endonuclease n=1 Tax=Psychrobacter sp. M13 TaxID=3067275 RepID=UPI00273BB09D|nr:restriction endonuclease [Psychrobacter sp. M13]WLP93643.1 restriction endonuclease [Psychrobacter sp. M13]